MSLYAGLDVHKKYTTMVVVDQQGYVQYKGKHEHNQDTLIDQIVSFNKPIDVVFESTYGWYWLADALQERGINFNLAHPAKVNAIAGKKKTDLGDAKILADLLRSNMLPQSYIPTKEERDIKELLRFRLHLVQEKAEIKIRLRDILAKQNRPSPHTDVIGVAGRLWLEEQVWSHPYDVEIKSLLTMVDALTEQIDQYNSYVKNQVKLTNNAQLLKSIPGIGDLLALTLAVEIGDIGRFVNARALASYAGVVPKVKSSGGKTHYGQVSKHGNRYIRWALAEAIPHITKKDAEFKLFYQRMQKHKANGKARVALMNKLIRLIHTMLSKQRTYQIRSVDR